MKKSTILLIAAWISAIAFLPKAKGQGAGNVVRNSNKETGMLSVHSLTCLSIPPELPGLPDINAVNERAIKDFKSRFSGAMNEKWYSIPGGYLCYFQIKGFDDRAFYDRKGQWLSSLKLYDEYKLPKEIRSLVRGIYFDFSITLVEEARIPNSLVYIIHMEDKNNAKILMVTSDGDIQTLLEYVRQ
jgi:hypothetical protein